MADQVDLEVLRRLASVSARINAGHRLEDTLQAVADGVVDAVGFGCAAVNYRLADGNFRVMAVTGPPEARQALQGEIISQAMMDALLERCEQWGALRYAPHVGRVDGEPTGWIPPVAVSDVAGAWHSDDGLLAPLCTGDGTLIGVLSVDLPPDQQRPGKLLCELLEMFAVQAGVAIQNASLTDELRREHDRLRASEELFRLSFNATTGPIGAIGLAPGHLGRFLRVNDAFCRVLGYSSEELATRTWSELVTPTQRQSSEALLEDFAARRRHDARHERQLLRQDGAAIWAAITATVVELGADQELFLLLHLEDITERKSHEDSLTRQAHLDHLTGLPNRRVLFRHLRNVIGEAVPASSTGVVLYCDLDGFKQINDHYGHAIGDLVLQEAATRLKAQVRTADVIGRLGGDEFVIIAADMDAASAERLVNRIRSAFARPLTTVPAVIDISVGVAAITSADDATVLLDSADQAMYADKHRGGIAQQSG